MRSTFLKFTCALSKEKIKVVEVISSNVIFDYRDPSSFMMRFLIEEIDEDSTFEDLQQMLVFALIYRVVVCGYEVCGHFIIEVSDANGYSQCDGYVIIMTSYTTRYLLYVRFTDS